MMLDSTQSSLLTVIVGCGHFLNVTIHYDIVQDAAIVGMKSTLKTLPLAPDSIFPGMTSSEILFLPYVRTLGPSWAPELVSDIPRRPMVLTLDTCAPDTCSRS
jgi:hypothetical protein